MLTKQSPKPLPHSLVIGISLVILALPIRAEETSSNWLEDFSTGARVWNPAPQTNESVMWFPASTNASDANNSVTGHGMVLWLTNGEEHQRATGNWKEGRLHGLAVWQQAQGHHYQGQWHNGQKHGVGVYTWPDGEQYKGAYQNDHRTEGILLRPDGTPINTLKSTDARQMMFDATDAARHARTLAGKIRRALIPTGQP